MSGEHKSFLGNLLILLGLNLIIKPFYVLGIEAEVQNRVGAEVFGSYFALFSFSFLLNIFLDMGITNYTVREVARSGSTLQRKLGKMIALRLLLAGGYLLLALAIGGFLGYHGESLFFLLLLAINQVLATFILFFRGALAGLHRFKSDAIISVLDRLVLIVLCAVLLWSSSTQDHFSITWFVFAQTAAYLFALMVALLMVLPRAKPIRISFDRTFSAELLRSALPFSVLIMTMAIYLRSDSVMLERLHHQGAKEAGIYAMGWRFFEAANMVAFLFGVLLLPMFSRQIARREAVLPTLFQAFRMLFPGAVILAIGCAFFATELMEWRYWNQTEAAAGCFRWLMIGFAGFSLNYLFGALLTADGRLWPLIRLAAICAVLNIAANALLIPKHGAGGAAVASAVTQWLMALVQVFLVRRQFSWDAKEGQVLVRAMVFATVVSAIGWGCTIFPGPAVLKAGSFTAAAGATALAFGYFRPAALKTLLANRNQDQKPDS